MIRLSEPLGVRGARPAWLGYAAAIIAVAAVTIVRRQLSTDVVGVYLLYTAAVMFASWYGGRNPGIVAVVGGALAGNFWISGQGAGWDLTPSGVANSLIFAAVGGVIVWLSDDLTRALNRVAALHSLTEGSLAQLDLNQLLSQLVHRLTDLLVADSAVVLLREGELLAPVATKGLPDSHLKLKIHMGTGFAGRVAAENRALVYNEIPDDLLQASPTLLGSGLRAVAGAPLRVGNEVRGVIVLGSRQPHCFGRDSASLLQVVADRVALAIENARLFARESDARRQAEAANIAKDRFLATVSHELRTPLTVITGWLWTLRQGDPPQREKAIDAIDRSAQNLSRLIEDLLDVARAMTGKLQLSVTPVLLPEVITKAMETAQLAVQAKRIRLTLEDDPDGVPILGDDGRLQQVFWNLLSNAVKFTPEGGEIKVRVERNGIHMIVSVADSGAGISREFLPYVFERFRQQDETSTRRYGGLGLGLSIVRHIVELHGGTVEAASEGEGRGATFTVTFPIPAVVQAVSRPAEAPRPVSLSGIRILCVDDQAEARDAVRAVLEQFGAQVVTAATVSEAVLLMNTYRPDVLLSDVAMPGEDGFALIKRLSEDGAQKRKTPSAALTAFGIEHRDRILAAGYDMYIPKPVAPPELAAMVMQLTAGRMH